MKNNLVRKGYGAVRENDRRPDCRRCRYDVFGECNNPKVTIYDIVLEEDNRVHCIYFEEAVRPCSNRKGRKRG